MKDTRPIVLFDFDGTLCDSERFTYQALRDLAPVYRFRPPLEGESARLRTLTSQEVLRELGIAKWKLPFIVWSARKRVAHARDQMRLFPGAAELVQTLKQKKFIVALLSSNSQSTLELLSARLGLEPDLIFGSIGLFGKTKALRRILRTRKWRPAQCLIVGDEPRDIDAAVGNQISAVGVAWGHASAARLRASGAASVAETMSELLVIIESWHSSFLSSAKPVSDRG